MKEKLEARKVAVEEENAKLKKDFDALQEKGKEINRQLTAIQARFNGNARVLNEITEMLKVDTASEEMQ